MSEEANMGVEETQEATAQATESTEHNDVSQEARDAEQRKRNDAEYNWAEMRRVKEELERGRERDREELAELRRQVQQFKSPSPEEEDSISDDEYAEGRHLKRLKKELNELKSSMQQKELSSMDERLHLRFTDYEEVMTPENVKLAEKLEPELAKVIGTYTDPYEKRVSAYRLIKRLTAKQEGPSAEKKKAEANSQKPLSVNAVTKNSAIGNAHLFENGLTPELKNQLYKEMREAMKAG